MNAAVPGYSVADDPLAEAGPAGFVRGVLRRLQPWQLLLAFSLLCATQVLGRLEYFRQTKYVWPEWQWKSWLLIDSLLIACVMLAVLVADEAVSRGARRWTTYLCAVVAGCLLATWIEWNLHALFGWLSLEGDTQPLRIFFSALLYGTLACFVYVNVRTARQAAERMRAVQLARAKSRRRTIESRLQAMQARVEPQFLFSTLAQVRELYERDTALAGRVLDDLISYLRAALPHLRESSSTLGQEIDLARAYLDIMRVRLGDSVDFFFDVPEAVKAARMPPMMLLPLIDHALVYGLQPADSPGTLRIATKLDGGRLRLAITDSGVAFLPGMQADGLDSISRRLHALYGDDAGFELERLRDRGTRATLEIPYEVTDGSDR